MEKKLLFVDDEKSILRALERLFMDENYRVFTAASGEEGLKLLVDHPVDIIVSDMRMPGMDGHQFLRKVKALYPSTTRLILSGYAQETEILESLIDGAVSLYLFKPWDSEELKKKIAQLFAAREIYHNPMLLQVVNSLENLSLVAGIGDSVCRLIEQDAEMATIAKVIETDPTVTASVLRIVNSAFYNIRTGSVLQAMTYLGLVVVKSIVLSCSVINAVKVQVPPFSISRLINHATTSNLLMAKIFRELLHKDLPDGLATAGLLHNLGLVMCLHYFPQQYALIAAEQAKPQGKIPLTTIERQSLGITHAELGGYLLNWWGIPYPTVECALFHHEPLHIAVLDQPAVGAIHLANYYAWKLVYPPLATELDERVFALLLTTRHECEKVMRE